MVLAVDMLTVNRDPEIPGIKRFRGDDAQKEFGWTAMGAAVKGSESSCKFI